MANGSLFGDIKSRLGFGGRGADDTYDDGYEDYGYDEYEDDYAYEDEQRDPYMERSAVTTRSSRSSRSSYSSASRSDAGLPRLVSMEDARASAKSIPYNRDASSARSSSIRSYGRTMVDSSLPPSMTAEGTAAAAAASNRRAEGLDSLFGSGSSGARAGSQDQQRSTLSVIGAAAGDSANSDIIRDSMQLSMPGHRKLQVIRPAKYDDAEAVTNVLKSGDAAILSFASTDRDLMKRILDFSFGAASAMDASVECVANGVFAICRSVPLDERERADLRNMDII